MIYLIKTSGNDIEFIKERIAANGWASILYDTVFFVDIQDEESAHEVYKRITTVDNQPLSTIVVKLSDDEDNYYWGRATNVVWDWLKEHSRKSV